MNAYNPQPGDQLRTECTTCDSDAVFTGEIVRSRDRPFGLFKCEGCGAVLRVWRPDLERAIASDTALLLRHRRLYLDDYPNCYDTFVTLCIQHPSLNPAVIDHVLGVPCTESYRQGDPRSRAHPSRGEHDLGGWYLSTRNKVRSGDARRHIDWLLDRLEPRAAQLDELRRLHHDMWLSCYWASEAGHGGPRISPAQSHRLAALGLELEFDVYCIE